MAAINPTSLTLGEVSVIEDLSGASIDAMSEPDAKKGKLMAAMAYVAKLREDPTYTFNEALGLTLGEMDTIIDFSAEDEDPKALEPAPSESEPSD